MNTNHDDLRRLVDGHFTRGLSRSNEERLRDHLPTCAACRQAYESYQVVERLERGPRGARERLAEALGLPSEARRSRRLGLGWAIGTAAAMGAVALLLVMNASLRTGNGMVPRGKAVENAESLDIAIFRVRGERESTRVKDVVSQGDELAFAYRNEVGKAFLMIFAIDGPGGPGHVAWYYPAWTDPAANPTAVPISKQVGFKELPQAVRHSLKGRSLTVHALFMDKALDVRTVESRVAKGEFAADVSAGESLRTFVLEVRP
jgi:hypothetical protein